MARARSPEKREALLQSAVRSIAEAGLGASTASIAKGAGLAEGTMFIYFSSKEELLNELYIELKTEVHGRIHANFPHQAELCVRVRHIWTGYLSWAMEKPDHQKVSVLLHLSPIISSVTKERVRPQQEAVARTMNELSRHGAFKDLPKSFASSAMRAMQEAVMEMVAKKPRQRTKLMEQAFQAFWRMAS